MWVLWYEPQKDNEKESFKEKDLKEKINKEKEMRIDEVFQKGRRINTTKPR